MHRKVVIPLILLLPLIVVLAGSANAEVFGYENVGTLGWGDIDYVIRGSVFNSPVNGTAENITAYLHYGSDGDDYQAAIYRISDHSKVGETAIRTDITGGGWWTFDFVTPPQLTASTSYVLVVRSTGGDDIPYDAGNEGQGKYEGGASFPSYDNFNSDNNLYSIYCTVAEPEWNEVETWTNRIHYNWYEVATWTNSILAQAPPPQIGWIIPENVTYVSGQESGHENIYTIDNDTDTYWRYLVSDTHEIWFELDNKYFIDNIRLYQPSVGTKWGINVGLTVWVSDNTDNWGDNVWEGILNAAGWQTSGVFYKAGNFIRLVSKSTDANQRMCEFNAHVETYKEWREVETWTSKIQCGTIIGYGSIGTSGSIITNAIKGSKYSSFANGRIDNLTAYINVLTSGNPADIRYAIYDENLNLVAQTENTTITDDGWYTLNFVSPPIISENENYWFCAWDNGTAVVLNKDNGDVNQGLSWAQTYGDNFPDTIRPPDEYDNNKYSIYTYYFASASPILPSQFDISSPDNNENITTTETPLFEWTQSENENYYRLLVDASPPDWKDLTIWETVADNIYVATFEMDDDNYAWKVYAVNDNGRTETNTRIFSLLTDAHVDTENATDTQPTSATLNATITSYGKYDNVEIRFEYKPYRSLVWGENWSLNDHYYNVPTDPATTGNWDSRTPVITVAAYDSDEYGTADYNCNEYYDDNMIQDAIDNASEQGGGMVFLYDGHYYTQRKQTENYAQIRLRSNITLMGENVENTFIIDNAGNEPSARMFVLSGQNILIENITAIGQGASIDREMSAFHINILTGDSIAQNIVVRNNVAENFAAIGVYSETSYLGNPENVWILNNRIERAYNQGIATVVGTNIYVDNNIIVNCGFGTPTKYGDKGNGILIWSIVNGAFVNNHMENSGGDGIFMSNYSDDYPCENIIVQGNLFLNNGRNGSNRNGVLIGGSEVNPLDNVTFRGNRYVDSLVDNMKYGIQFYTSYAENFVIENNNFVMIYEPLVLNGVGHIVENNVGLYLNTDWQLVESPTSTFAENVENMQQNWTYQYRALIRTFDNETEDGGVVTYQLFGWVTAEIWTNKMETPQWWEIVIWTNYIDTTPITWNEVEIWTNYVHVLNWYEVETWVNYAVRSSWYEVATWTNYLNVFDVGWYEIETWTNRINSLPPNWEVVGEWTNQINARYPEWLETQIYTNYLEGTIYVAPDIKPLVPFNVLINYIIIPIIVLFAPALLLAEEHGFIGFTIGIGLGLIVITISSVVSLTVGMVILILISIIVLYWRGSRGGEE